MFLFHVQYNSDSMNDIFMSDTSIYAKLKGLFEDEHHGMSYRAANAIVRTDGQVIVGMLYLLITIYLWKFSLKNETSKKEKSDLLDKRSKYLHKGKINIIAIIFGSFMLISLFLPSFTSDDGTIGSVLNYFFKLTIRKYGYLCLLLSIGAIISLILKYKYSMWFGILYLFFAIIGDILLLNRFYNIFNDLNLKLNLAWISLFLSLISSILFIIFSKKEIKKE